MFPGCSQHKERVTVILKYIELSSIANVGLASVLRKVVSQLTLALE